MNWSEQLLREFSAQRAISRKRIWFAFAVALITDGLQFGLGPFGWVLVDQGLDVLAMILISWAIGFHMLLLPTFVIEFIPGPDMLPTWTACTAAVVMLRKKSAPKPPIDITSEVTPVTAADDKPNGAPPKIGAPQTSQN
ncbi:MAG TPA: hypothetical protein VFE51_26605 [Verrucomicrobiae bacterium]|nr:hypothetical protein [Verrucomicrobiae bacterium]